MASLAMGSLPVPKAIQISGITTHLVERLEHPLLIKLTVGSTVSCVFLKREEKHVGARSFQKPLRLSEGSILTVQVQENRSIPRKHETLALLNLSLENILRGQSSGTADIQTMKYQIQLNDGKRIWLNVVPLPSVLQSDPSGMLQNAVKVHPHNKMQDLKELKDRLLEGIKSIDPRAIECVAGTRTRILADIATKTDNPDDTNAIWIRGAPGSGKSSISLSAKARLHRQGRLVTYFRFDRNEASTTTPSALWRRVASDLARRLPSIQPQLLQLLRSDKVDLESPLAVFTYLVEEPLLKLPVPPVGHPLVIVIDALDECGGLASQLSPDRQVLLQTLRRWTQLSKYYKLLVTSREEGDLARVLSSISTPIDIPSGRFLTENPQDEASIHASSDIRIFLEGRFRQIKDRIPSLPKDWPGTATVTDLANRAAGIFMWATAAMNFIDGRGIDPKGRLGRIMADVSEPSGMKPLYSLYITILDATFGDLAIDDPEAEILRFILGTIVLAKRPLRDIELTKLPTSEPVTQVMLDALRDGLQSVIAPGTLRFVHKSFDDFLLSKECPPKYAINRDDSQYLLTQLCLTTMTAELRFNMCNLETSCMKNVDVPDIDVRVTNGISTLLSYSCCFFAAHLSEAPFDHFLMDEVRDMVLDKLLYWFEAMSLLKEFNQVSPSLLSVLKWSHPSPDDEFREFLRDAREFIAAFGNPVAQSAPHVYISALPFAPEYSPVARQFLPRFPRILSLSTGKPTDWSPCVFTSEHHKGAVLSGALSPDERYFVSASDDGTVCIRDFETGNPISGPFHFDFRGAFLCTFLDPNGKCVWICRDDGTVVGWDVKTGGKHLEFQAGIAIGCRYINGEQNIIALSRTQGTLTLWSADTAERRHDLPIDDINEVNRVILSPNGCYVASVGYHDTIVRTWELVVGSEIRLIRQPSPSQPQFQHTHARTISALSFAVDGDFVVSGGNDGAILIWDVKTGDAIGPPLITVTEPGRVSAVAYTHNNKLVVSTTNLDNSTHGQLYVVMVWNALTHEAILGPLEGHTLWINAITLSCDGRRALTVSSDRTVRKWDLFRKTGGPPLSPSNEGHRNSVVRFAFSPCGTRLASLGYYDRTIRLWNTKSGEPLLPPIQFPDTQYIQIMFSPDASRIVAYGSNCGIVRVCSTDTGRLIFELNLADDREKYTGIETVAFGPAGQQLLTCSEHGIIRFWSSEGEAMAEDLFGSSPCPIDADKPVDIIALSPDGLAAIVRDKSRNPRHYLWNTTTHKPLPLIFADDEHVSGDPDPQKYSWSYSGVFFAVASNASPSTLRVWNTRTGELAADPFTLPDNLGQINCLALSPDGSRVALSCYYHGISRLDNASTAIWIWNTRTSLLTSRHENGHTCLITALTFSPDGEKLVSGSWDGQIRIWNAADLPGALEVHNGIKGVGMHIRDGWVVDADGKLRFWVPDDHREQLLLHGTVAVTGGGGIRTQLDLTGFRYGERWAECFEGRE